MKTYNVKTLDTAEDDIEELADFLFENLSKESAYRYLEVFVDRILHSSVW